MNEFFGNTRDDIYREMAQWQVDGELSGDDDIDVDGVFYNEAKSEVQNALLKGHFPTNISESKCPVAYSYIASLHRKLTALLYIQSRRINISTDQDTTRGMWAGVRRKLNSISNGESFGELSSPHSSQSSSFICYNECHGLSVNRGL